MPETPLKSDESISIREYYTIIRDQIEHEDNLIGQRLSWFVAAQSFYFTAYAIVMSNIRGDHTSWVTSQMRLLLILLPMVAILTSLLIYATVIAGLVAMAKLRDLYRKFVARERAAGLPPVQGYRRTQILGQAAPMLLPGIFIAIWMILLVHGPW